MQSYITAASILLGFAMVAGAIFVQGLDFIGPSAHSLSQAERNTVVSNQDLSAMAGEVSRAAASRVYGNTDAKTTIVEFSDLECPFCARVHPTIKRIVDESGGSINWEYRHLPLPMHSGADDAAILSECVGDELGNEAFWTYIDRIFAGEATSVSAYKSLALELGLTEDSLTRCENSEELASRIAGDMETAKGLGGSGTPFSVIVAADGSLTPVRGALPYQEWQRVLP